MTSLLLAGLREGDRAAMDARVAMLYDELRGPAHRQQHRWHREQTAAALGISLRTVRRDWTYAQAWLNRELELTV